MAVALAERTGFSLGHSCAQRFENGELHVSLQTSVAKQDCFLLGSIAPPDESLLSSLLLAHTLKKEGASRVTAVLPYLAYARDDKDKPGQCMATAWIAALTRASGIDEVITVDAHSERAKELFPIPVRSLSSAPVFADAMVRYHLEEATIVAPDNGAISRCQAVLSALGRAAGEVPFFEKHRTPAGIVHGSLTGKVGRQVVIVDDILDTGGTLVSACERLRETGLDEIDVMVTHGLFTGDRWKRLWEIGVKRVFCTDSVPFPAGLEEKNIVRLSVVALIQRELCATVKA